MGRKEGRKVWWWPILGNKNSTVGKFLEMPQKRALGGRNDFCLETAAITSLVFLFAGATYHVQHPAAFVLLSNAHGHGLWWSHPKLSGTCGHISAFAFPSDGYTHNGTMGGLSEILSLRVHLRRLGVPDGLMDGEAQKFLGFDDTCCSVSRLRKAISKSLVVPSGDDRTEVTGLIG